MFVAVERTNVARCSSVPEVFVYSIRNTSGDANQGKRPDKSQPDWYRNIRVRIIHVRDPAQIGEANSTTKKNASGVS
jgi:hypothetical protein